MPISMINKETIKQTVDTSPLKIGGTNFRTKKLKQNSSSKLSFHPTIGYVMFSLLFGGIGYAFLGYVIHMSTIKEISDFEAEWVMLLIGIMFGGLGTLLLYNTFKPCVFNKSKNLYHKSYANNKDNRNNRRIQKNQLPLNEIVAIQIIGELITNKNKSYNSFELNLILTDNTRRNVIDHGNLKAIISDAERLSDFLSIPILHSKPLLKGLKK